MDEDDQEKTSFVTSQGLLLQSYALWIEERRSHLQKIGELYVFSLDWEECGGVCGWYAGEK